MTFSDSDITNYFDLTRNHYNFFWKVNKYRTLHYGYWDETTKNFSQALMKINSVMAQKAGIKDGMKILDTGCGEGGSLAWVASHYKVEVTGITLSEKQMGQGNAFLTEQNLSSKARIEVQSFLQTKFPDNSFDVVWAIESVCYAHNKKEYLEEMFRILKPGGKIILADFFVPRQLNEKEKTIMNKMAYSWAVPFFELTTNFLAFAKEVGFKSAVTDDITSHVAKSIKRLYFFFYMGLPVSLLYNLFHPNVPLASKNNVYSAYWQYVGYKKKLWSYQLFLIEK